jgi:hypothetical protein
MRKNHDDLLALEKKFWSGDSAFFAANADTECLVAFPDMAGVMENADLAATAKNPRRWKELEIEQGRDRAVQRRHASVLRSGRNARKRRALQGAGFDRLQEAPRRLEDDVPQPDAA